MEAGEPPKAASLTTSQVAWRLLPLYFTHVNQALLVTLPFAVAVYMVRDFEAAASGGAPVSEQAVGRATGMLAAVFCAAQLLTSYPWGMISDRIGRKPVLIIGNISCVVSVVLFGLSGTYWQAVAARAVGGFLNAIILVEKAMIGEGFSDKDSQAKAFGLLALCWGLGSLAGPLVGGALSAPCSSGLRIGALCGQGSLLVHRPYFLPCLVAGLLSAAATVMCMTGLDETLPSRRAIAPDGANGSGSGSTAKKARYEAVPMADAVDGGPASWGGEVELGGMRQQDSDTDVGGGWGGNGSGGAGAPGEAPSAVQPGAAPAVPPAKAAPMGTSGTLRRFRGDSAMIGAGWGRQLQSQRPHGDDAGSSGGEGDDGSLSRRVGSSSSGSSSQDLDIEVFGPGDLERGQHPQQQSHKEEPQQQAQELDRLLPGSASQQYNATAEAGAEAVLASRTVPWYRQSAVLASLLGYGLIAFVFNMLDEVTPIFASAGVPEGGLGFSPSQLAPSLSFSGLVLVVWALKGFPWLMRRVGVVRALRLGLWHTAPVALLIPTASLFGGAQVPSQVIMFLSLGAKAITASNAFTGCLILVNASAPVDSLGAVNGAGQSLASLVRALGPALGGLSWGWSHQLAQQHWWPAWLPPQFLPFIAAVMVTLGTDVVYWDLRLPEGDKPGGGERH